MKVLITGISGFVGEYLTKILKEHNNNVQIFGLERNTIPFKLFPELNKSIQVINCDITDRERIDEIIAKIQPDQVYHLAGFASAAGKDQGLIYDVNVQGSINVLNALKKLNKKPRILLASTAYIYGNTLQPAKEDDKIHPQGPYARSKAEMEKQALRNNDSLEIIISRTVNHSGPGQKLGFVVPDFVSQIAKVHNNEKILVGNLEAQRDFLDVKDVVEAYLILMKKGISGQIYNVSSGKTISIQKLLEKIIEISGKKVKIKIDPTRVRPIDIKINCLDYCKIKKLGWQPKVNFDQTLKNVLQYWQTRSKV